MQDKTGKQSNFHYADHNGRTHKMGGFIEHFPIVIRIKDGQIGKNAGIDTHVHN
jgi:hypothetical protein